MNNCICDDKSKEYLSLNIDGIKVVCKNSSFDIADYYNAHSLDGFYWHLFVGPKNLNLCMCCTEDQIIRILKKLNKFIKPILLSFS